MNTKEKTRGLWFYPQEWHPTNQPNLPRKHFEELVSNDENVSAKGHWLSTQTSRSCGIASPHLGKVCCGHEIHSPSGKVLVAHFAGKPTWFRMLSPWISGPKLTCITYSYLFVYMMSQVSKNCPHPDPMKCTHRWSVKGGKPAPSSLWNLEGGLETFGQVLGLPVPCTRKPSFWVG